MLQPAHACFPVPQVFDSFGEADQGRQRADWMMSFRALFKLAGEYSSSLYFHQPTFASLFCTFAIKPALPDL